MSEPNNKIEIPTKFIKPFGPRILKLNINSAMVEDFNIAFHQIIDMGRQQDFLVPEKFKQSVSTQMICPFDVLKGYTSFFQQSLSGYLSSLKKEGLDIPSEWTISISNARIIKCIPGDFIKDKEESNDSISCIGVLDVSKSDNDTSVDTKIEFSYSGGSSAFFRNSVGFTPLKGDFYFFPTKASVSMLPFKSDCEIIIFWAELSVSMEAEESAFVWNSLLPNEYLDDEHLEKDV